MKNFLKIPLFGLVLTVMLSMFTGCQTESINDDTLDPSENSDQINALTPGVSEKLVAIYSTRNGTYISSENGGNVTCNRKEVGTWETITMVTWPDETISFKGNNGLYLSDENGGDNIRFNREEAGLWEKFTYNGSTITRGELTLNGSNENVNFNGGAYWDFKIIGLPTDTDNEIVSEKLVAIKSIRRGTYLCSENGGNVSLSDRTEIGAWETFTMVTWKDGTFSLKGNNGLYLSDGHGNPNIKFDEEEAGEYEKFTYENPHIISSWGSYGNAILGDIWDSSNQVYNTTFSIGGGSNTELEIIELSDIVSEKLVAIRSIRRGTYLCSENGGNVSLSDRTEVGAWETFTMITWKDGTFSLKGNNGLYLSDGHGNPNIKFDEEEVGEFEKFTYDGANIISVWGNFGSAVLGDVWDEANRVFNTTFSQAPVSNSELEIIEL